MKIKMLAVVASLLLLIGCCSIDNTLQRWGSQAPCSYNSCSYHNNGCSNVDHCNFSCSSPSCASENIGSSSIDTPYKNHEIYDSYNDEYAGYEEGLMHQEAAPISPPTPMTPCNPCNSPKTPHYK